MRRGGVKIRQFRYGGSQFRDQTFFHLRHALDLRIEAAGGGERRDLGHGLGAGSAAAFLFSANKERLNSYALANIQRSDALDGVDLMAADADEVCAERLRFEGDLAESLYGVRVEKRTGARGFYRVRDRTDIRDRSEGFA